jgi:peptidyl-prolyl cis-trans isomerase C
MILKARKAALLLTLTMPLLWLGACSDNASDAVGAKKASNDETTSRPSRREGEPMDVVARVGDQYVTFGDLNTMINSAAIVGLSMTELGSPERDTVRLTLLDKMITANLLYLDAKQKGLDQDPEYQKVIDTFRDSILISLYRSKHLVGDIEVSEQDIQEFYKNNIDESTELTDDLKVGIEATHKSSIVVSDLDPGDDQIRSDDDVLAKLDGVGITWGKVRSSLQRAQTLNSTHARVEALEKIIDNRIMAQKAKEIGLEQDKVYQARVNEFEKTRLINIHRAQLIDSWDPGAEEVKAYYEVNKEDIIVREVRKVQMLVVETEEEAEKLKQQIESKEITFHKAVADHSIIKDAKKTLGQIGWVSEDSGFPELDKETFLLEAGEIGGPVKSPAGWHLVRILDQRDALNTDINDEATYKKTRRLLLKEKLNSYVINLRKDKYAVDVDDDLFSELAQQEVDWYQEKLKTSQKTPEEIKEDIVRLQKMEN